MKFHYYFLAYFLIIMALVAILDSCHKPAYDLTGDWSRGSVFYSFYDDSRFKQSDLSGQWVWQLKGDVLYLYGQPDREMKVEWISGDEVKMIEVDTFTLIRL
jgi:hypothetical protein